MSVPRIFQTQEPRAGEVRVVGLDGALDVGQGQGAVRLLRQGLGLDAAQHSGPTAFKPVGMRKLPHQHFIAAGAVGHQCAQIALRAARHKERCLFAEQGRHALLQRIDAGVVAEHIVAHCRTGHGVAHTGGRACDRVAAQIDHVRRSRVWGRGCSGVCHTVCRRMGCRRGDQCTFCKKLRSMA